MADIKATPETSPPELLARIQEVFRNLGRLGEKLTLTHEGRRYLVSCDEEAFTVYRLLDQGHRPPGRPGWPVCLVTAETVIDETGQPALKDEFASGLSLENWLRLIESVFRPG